jgi:hypothetical protein
MEPAGPETSMFAYEKAVFNRFSGVVLRELGAE